MENRPAGTLISPATRVVLRVVIYYAILIVAGWVVLDRIPSIPGFSALGIDSLLNPGPPVGASKSEVLASATLDESSRSQAVAAAMIAAILLSLPVAWIYQLTRQKRGYQQSVVQLMIILPLVVAGVVILVKNSLALAFSLGGIVAAVRFRNSLDDSKDAVYVFLATGVGLAAAVGAGISMAFSEALSDTGELTGRGSPLRRGLITGVMTFVGGVGHTLPFLLGNYHAALTVAFLVVGLELVAIAYIRYRYFSMRFWLSVVQVVVGGLLVFASGVFIGSRG